MRKYGTTFILIMVLVFGLFLFTTSCEPEGPTPPDATIEEESPVDQAPAAVTKVKSKWSGGDLDFTQTDGTVIMGLDGTNGDVEIATATITTSTVTTLTSTTTTTGTINPSANGTKDLGGANLQWRYLYLYSQIRTAGGTANLTLPTSSDTLVGRATTDTLTNKTLTSPTITSPTITGTGVVANRASGNVTISSGSSSAIVTHGLSGQPTQILLTYINGVPGTSTSSTAGNDCYWSTANSTKFTVNLAASANASTVVQWLALIAGE